MSLFPIKWYGGKRWMLTKLLPLISEHELYVEPFGGGAVVLVNKGRCSVEVYNDVDQTVVNFFRVLRDQPGELVRRIELTPRARWEWNDCTARHADEDLDDVERARMFYAHVYQSWCGMRKYWAGVPSFREPRRHRSELRNRASRLMEVARRFNRVVIEWLDFRDLLPKYDVPEAFFYCDPPYVKSSRVSPGVYGEFEMSDDDHRGLCHLLRQLCGKVMLSGYDNDIYRDLLGDWEVRRYDAASHVGKTETKDRREECVWLNRRAAIGAQGT